MRCTLASPRKHQTMEFSKVETVKSFSSKMMWLTAVVAF
jgi:hypothetical protein